MNAGTVEFLLEGDGDDARFYFLEMNTRLQVEHPVTEAVTGLDLVRAQLRVADGEPLPFRRRTSAPRGHAIECRVYAEDARRLLPQSRDAAALRRARRRRRPRRSGVVEGQTVTVHYDPLLAKLIAHGATRATPRSRARSRRSAVRDPRPAAQHLASCCALLERPEFREHARTRDSSRSISTS